MKKINLICIRHGLSIANECTDIYYEIPDHRIPLSEVGEKQSKNLCEQLLKEYPDKDNNVIIKSPWERTNQTANALKDLSNHQIQTELLIHEILVNTSYDCMKKRKPFNFDEKEVYSKYWYKQDSEESFVDVYQRAINFITELKFNKYGLKDNQNVFIISHGVFLSMLEVALDKKELEQSTHLDNCGYFKRTLEIL